MAKKKAIFINREEIRTLILEFGEKEWDTFKANELVKVGNQYRCQITADGKEAILDFYFNTDGSTTIRSTGKNGEISSKIKIFLEQSCTYSNDIEGKTYSFKKLPTVWSSKLILYLETLAKEKPIFNKFEKQPAHDIYKFTSKIGDTLVVNIYSNGTITLQGKPAYLYREAISFLSYCDDVSVDDIVNTINNAHDVAVRIDDVRNEMKVLLPYSYSNLDEMILKLLSPSISLRKIKMPLEDYSCYAFPALRALEGYIKFLCGKKSITVGNGFGRVFNNGVLATHIANSLNDTVFQRELERLYHYFVNNRHVIFHAEQCLMATTILNDKQEADDIVNNVLNLIETSYINIHR